MHQAAPQSQPLDEHGNSVREAKHTQVCLWPDVAVQTHEVDAFRRWMLTEFGVRAQYLETVVTKPDVDDKGHPVPGTGGRQDVLFAIHDDDITEAFCHARLHMGMKWIEDVFANHNAHLYDERIGHYRSWDAPLVTDELREQVMLYHSEQHGPTQ